MTYPDAWRQPRLLYAALFGWFLMLSAAGPVRASSATVAWNGSMPGCTVFEQQRAQGGRNHLPAGPLVLPDNQDGFASGYRARSMLTDVGDLETITYDCSRHMTANGVAARLQDRLEAAGYTLQFACRGSRCGPPAGWKQLLGLHAAPGADAFNYSVATRQSVKGPEHVAVYAADLDQRPRVVIYDLQADYDLPAKLEFDQSRLHALNVTGKAQLASVSFATGSAQIESTQDLRAALAGVSRADSAWVVVGHADPRGQRTSNGLLSWRRARAVADALVDLGVPATAIQRYAVGASALLSDVSDRDSAATAAERRVDVFRLASPPPAAEKTAEKRQERTRTEKSGV